MVLIAATITALSGMTGSLRADVGSWTHHFGMSGLDEAGAAYVPGKTFVTLPGQTPGGTLDAFVPTYDSAGRELWIASSVRQPGTVTTPWRSPCTAGDSWWPTAPEARWQTMPPATLTPT